MHTTPDYTITTPAGDRVVPGTVFVFTADLTFMGPRWRNRILGAHMVVTGYSDRSATASEGAQHLHRTATR